jgi:hypothetical protein
MVCMLRLLLPAQVKAAAYGVLTHSVLSIGGYAAVYGALTPCVCSQPRSPPPPPHSDKRDPVRRRSDCMVKAACSIDSV